MKAATVDDYLDSQPDDVRKMLVRVRNALKRALPKSEEVISYGIPAIKVHGKIAVYYAGWKAHYSLYPAGSKAVLAHFKDELAGYKQSRGTIKLPLDKPVPVKLIERIAKFRAKELA